MTTYLNNQNIDWLGLYLKQKRQKDLLEAQKQQLFAETTLKIVGTAVLLGLNYLLNKYVPQQSTLAINKKGGIIKGRWGTKTVEKELPEIVVTPNEENALLRELLSEMIPDPLHRRNFLNRYQHVNVDHTQVFKRNGMYIIGTSKIPRDLNKYFSRLYDLWKNSGTSPKIGYTLNNPLKAFIGNSRPMSAPWNTTYVNTPDELVTELPHSYQYKRDGYMSGIPLISGNGFADWRVDGKTAYERPGTFEYEAHSEIEPRMRNYVNGYTNEFNYNK